MLLFGRPHLARTPKWPPKHASLAPVPRYQFGGLLRPVLLTEVPARYIDRLEVRELSTATSPRCSLALRLVLRSASASRTLPPEALFDLRWDGVRLLAAASALVTVHGAVELQLQLPTGAASARWSPGSPRLHELRATLLRRSGCELDTIVVRVGLRQVGVSADGVSLTLDGAPLKLRGLNRHDYHPMHGAALPYAAIMADMHWMRKAPLLAPSPQSQTKPNPSCDLEPKRGAHTNPHPSPRPPVSCP